MAEENGEGAEAQVQPVPPAESGAERPEEAGAASLEERLDRLAALLAERLSYDGGKETLIARLGEELSAMREDRLRAEVRPLLIDLAMLHDSLESMLEGASGDEPSSALLEVLRSEVRMSLERHGVAPYRSAGGPLEPRRQRTLSVAETGDPELDGKVARSLRAGYLWGTQVLRPEDVVVHRLRRAVPSGSPEEPDGAGE